MEKIYDNNVIWMGTAEVDHRLRDETSNDSIRVDVALVSTPRWKKEKILVKWGGKWISEKMTSGSREYEDAATGELICDSNIALSNRITAVLNFIR